MFRVTSLADMPDKQLNRWIRRLALLVVAVLVVFVAFYVFDRYNPIPKASLADRQIAAAEEAVRNAPSDIAARGTLADLYVSVRRYTDAISQYDAIIATGNDEELARIGRAKANQALGNLDAAAQDWRRVVEIAAGGEMAAVDPNLAGAYYELGTISQTQGKPADAVDYLTKSLAISRTDADTLYALGIAYTALDRTDDAISALKSAIAFVPVGWSEPYTALAAAYAKKGDTPMASWATAMAALASSDTKTAEAGLKALVGGPADTDALIGLGLVAEARGDSVTAAGYYQQVLAKDPSNAAARLGMSRVRPVATAPAASPSQEGQP